MHYNVVLVPQHQQHVGLPNGVQGRHCFEYLIEEGEYTACFGYSTETDTMFYEGIGESELIENWQEISVYGGFTRIVE